MNSKTERLNEIFGNPEFLEAHKDLDNFDAIYKAVLECDSDISREELTEYLELISKNMDNGEISEADLEDVAGGGILAVAAGIAGVCAAISGCYKVGTGIGKFIYNVTHR